MKFAGTFLGSGGGGGGGGHSVVLGVGEHRAVLICN